MDDDDTDPIAAAHRSKLRELRRLKNDGDRRIATAMAGSASPELVVRAAAIELQDEVLRFAKQAVRDLALAHVRYGRASVADIAEEVRTRFVDEGLKGGIPAGGLFRQTHGFADFSANGQRLMADSEARLSMLRAGLRQEVADIVVQALAEHPRKNWRQRADEYWKTSAVGGVVAAAIGISTIATIVVTWTGKVQEWRAAPARVEGAPKAVAISSDNAPARSVSEAGAPDAGADDAGRGVRDSD